MAAGALIERIRTWAQAHGGAFASWAAAIEAADVPPHPGQRTTWPRESIIERIRAWAEEYGASPTRADWSPGSGNPEREPGQWPNAQTVLAQFGSWEAALNAAEVDEAARAPAETWSRERIWSGCGHGRPTTMATVRAATTGSSTAIPIGNRVSGRRLRRCTRSSVPAGALDAAGVTARPREPRSVKRWTPEVVIERLRAWAATHNGRLPRPGDWRRGGHPDWSRGAWPSVDVVRRTFGSWLAALTVAASEPDDPALPVNPRTSANAPADELDDSSDAPPRRPRTAPDEPAMADNSTSVLDTILGDASGPAPGALPELDALSQNSDTQPGRLPASDLRAAPERPDDQPPPDPGRRM